MATAQAPIVLTGASGFIAKHILHDLLSAGKAVRATVRSESRAEELKTLMAEKLGEAALERLEFAYLDLSADEGWEAALSGASALLHTASPFVMSNDEDALVKPAVEGTERALKAAAKAGVKRVVLTSSMVAIYASERWDQGVPLDESDWTNLDLGLSSAYEKSKTLAELRAWELAKELDLELTTINPGVVWGPPLDMRFGTSLELVERMFSGRDPAQPDIDMPVVDVRDVSAAHVRALDSQASIGKRTVMSAGTLSLVDVAKHLKALYPDSRVRTGRAPNWLIRLVGLFDPVAKMAGPRLGVRQTYDNSRARTDLSIDFISPQDALAEAAKAVRAKAS